MNQEKLFPLSPLGCLSGMAVSVVIGFLGGGVCGSVILSLCGLAGRSQTTGAEYIGYWSFGFAMVGAAHGALLGAVLGPIGYVAVVRKVGFGRAILPAAVGTVVVGFAGSLANPGLGVIAGTLGFFVGLLFARFRSPLRAD